MTAFSTVVLVSMPFVELSRPCLGLSLLKSLLLEDGLSVRVEYGSLTLAERIGFRDYSWITESNRFWSHVMLGEYLYASSAFPNRKRDDKRVLDLLFAYSALKGEKLTAVRAKTLLRLRRLEKEATAHIDSTAKSILAQKPKIVGCTSTFQQHVSSLALLKRIRELQPDVVTMMGCLLYTSPSPRDRQKSRMPSSA